MVHNKVINIINWIWTEINTNEFWLIRIMNITTSDNMNEIQILDEDQS